MEHKEAILDLANKKRKIKTSDVVRELENKISRQYTSRLLSELVAEGRLVKAGSTRKAFYALPRNISALGNYVKKRFRNKNLSEHEILELIKQQAPFILHLKDNVRSIFDYAFSEMLNNAIEHSKSEFIEIEVGKQNCLLSFQIRDFGIGVFRNVMEKRKLNSEFEAMEDLLKGKTTTMPQAHSGEGIFFTSKAADVFLLDSFSYRLTIDNEIKDVLFEKLKYPIRGTRASFRIALTSRKHLTDIFNRYQVHSDDFAFNKTEIQIKLYTMGTVHVSRSQARRVLSGLEKFEMVVLDFDKVPTIGQAFADEIFRVFKNKHPEIEILAVNMNKTVEFMIKRVGRLG